MRPDSRDLTIDSALSDPMIRAVMRADRIEARDVEIVLRSAARRLAAAQAPSPAFRLGRACLANASLCHA